MGGGGRRARSQLGHEATAGAGDRGRGISRSQSGPAADVKSGKSVFKEHLTWE